jgi:hypothetical protein
MWTCGALQEQERGLAARGRTVCEQRHVKQPREH